MRRGRALALLLGACVVLVAPAAFAQTRIAAIEATAPLEDRSDEAIDAAIATAVRTAARGALAMGLQWLHVQGAYVRDDYVGVKVVATDQEPEADGPGLEPDHDEAPIDEPLGGEPADTVPTYRL